jgi:hypothetical protein
MWSSAEAIAVNAEEKMLLEQLLSAGSTPRNVNRENDYFIF